MLTFECNTANTEHCVQKTLSVKQRSLKAKAVPLHAMKALGGEKRYSSYSSMTSALDGVSGQHHAPAALCPGERTPVPIVKEAGWDPEPVWTQRLGENSFRLYRRPNLDRPVIQPVARHYTA
jgi:hypothetical protein